MATSLAAPNAGAPPVTAEPAASQPVATAPTSYAGVFDTPEAEKPQPDGRAEGSASTDGTTESQPATGEKPTATPAGQEENVPWNKDPRFQQFLADRKALETKQQTYDALLELVPSVEEAQVLLERARTADQAQERFTAARKTFQDDPIGLANWWKQTHPEAFHRLLDELRPGVLMDLVDLAQRAGDTDAVTVLQGLSEKIAAPSSRDAKDPGAARVKTLERQLQERDNRDRQAGVERFNTQIREGYTARLRETFNTLTKAIAFKSPEQQEHLFERALNGVLDEVDTDSAFNTRMESLLKSGKLDAAHATQMINACMARAMFKGTFEKHLSNLIKWHGLERVAEQANADLAKAKAAAERKEPASAGSPASPNGGGSNQERMRKAATAGKDPYAELFGD